MYMTATDWTSTAALRVRVRSAFEGTVSAQQHGIEDKNASPAVSGARVTGQGLMLLPLAPHLAYARVARGLQRVKFTVRHLGERHHPLEKKCLGIASR